jgi:DUF4097 and DUF4098 domain-containing protein YvlB
MLASLKSIFAITLPSFLLAVSLHATVTETVQQTFPISAQGSVRLENVNGNIEITAWEHNEIAFEAIKSAKTEEKLKDIVIEIDAKPDQLSIKTKRAKAKGWFNNGTEGSVHYKLKVPATVNLSKIDAVNATITVKDVRGTVDIETVNGRITATGLAGKAEFETVNGTIDVGFASLDKVSSIDLETVNGAATLTLPKGAGASIDAETLNGRIEVAQAITLSKSGKREIKGVIGHGGTKVEIETVNGSITIKEAQ